MEDKAKPDIMLTWKVTIIWVATMAAAVSVFPLAKFAQERYEFNLSWQKYYAENAAQDFKTMNDICINFIQVAGEQRWENTKNEWSRLCQEKINDHFREFYGDK